MDGQYRLPATGRTGHGLVKRVARERRASASSATSGKSQLEIVKKK